MVDKPGHACPRCRHRRRVRRRRRPRHDRGRPGRRRSFSNDGGGPWSRRRDGGIRLARWWLACAGLLLAVGLGTFAAVALASSRIPMQLVSLDCMVLPPAISCSLSASSSACCRLGLGTEVRR
eukprot:SM000322S12513  [mRNA]  locus=s322:63903:64494:+ [translate_table: standard]